MTEILGSWFQFEIHKYCNGDNFEECDKHNDCNWRTLYFPETAEPKSLDCHVLNGKHTILLPNLHENIILNSITFWVK